MVISAKIIEEDREATRAFRGAHPPEFDGSRPEETMSWINTINRIFEGCHIKKRMYKTLAWMQLKGEALNWWYRQHDTPANENWETMSAALLTHYQPQDTEEAQGNLYLFRWASWRRNTGESLQEYVARFKEEILSIAPPDESQKDLIWLFWKELPAVIKGLLEIAPYLDSVEAVLKESLEIASSLDIEEGGPEYTPSD